MYNLLLQEEELPFAHLIFNFAFIRTLTSSLTSSISLPQFLTDAPPLQHWSNLFIADNDDDALWGWE